MSEGIGPASGQDKSIEANKHVQDDKNQKHFAAAQQRLQPVDNVPMKGAVPSALPLIPNNQFDPTENLAPVNHDLTVEEALVNAKDTGIGVLRQAADDVQWLGRNLVYASVKQQMNQMELVNKALGEPLSAESLTRIKDDSAGLNREIEQVYHARFDDFSQNVLKTDPDGEAHQGGRGLMMAAEIATGLAGLAKVAPRALKQAPKIAESIQDGLTGAGKSQSLQSMLDEAMHLAREKIPEWPTLKEIDNAAIDAGLPPEQRVYAMADRMGFNAAYNTLQRIPGIYPNVKRQMELYTKFQGQPSEVNFLNNAKKQFAELKTSIEQFEKAAGITAETSPEDKLRILSHAYDVYSTRKNELAELESLYPELK
jgi:hypothetical protein